MEKLIAFNIYRKNEHGAFSAANRDGDPRDVYLASEVDARIASLRSGDPHFRDCASNAAVPFPCDCGIDEWFQSLMVR